MKTVENALMQVRIQNPHYLLKVFLFIITIQILTMQINPLDVWADPVIIIILMLCISYTKIFVLRETYCWKLVD